MANKYFINLPEKTTPEDSNILPIEDSQDTKRTTLANLKTAILASHLAESAAKHIHSSGSNANGRYIRFDNGTQICWGEINLGSRTANGSGTYTDPYRTGFNSDPHPATFVGRPYAVFTPLRASDSASRGMSVVSGVTTSIGFFEVQGISVTGGSEALDVLVTFVTIGRWK